MTDKSSDADHLEAADRGLSPDSKDNVDTLATGVATTLASQVASGIPLGSVAMQLLSTGVALLRQKGQARAGVLYLAGGTLVIFGAQKLLKRSTANGQSNIMNGSPTIL